MAIQGKLKTTEAEVDAFCRKMLDDGHRLDTVLFAKRNWGQELSLGRFTAEYKKTVKTGASPSKCRGLYEYLASCGVIRINEQ